MALAPLVMQSDSQPRGVAARIHERVAVWSRGVVGPDAANGVARDHRQAEGSSFGDDQRVRVEGGGHGERIGRGDDGRDRRPDHCG